jgi:hypothetical protein
MPSPSVKVSFLNNVEKKKNPLSHGHLSSSAKMMLEPYDEEMLNGSI